MAGAADTGLSRRLRARKLLTTLRDRAAGLWRWAAGRVIAEGADPGAAASLQAHIDSAHRHLMADPGRPNAPQLVLVSVVGLEEAPLQDAVERTLATVSETGVAPVFLTDSPNFAIFHRHRAWFEYLPSRDSQQRFAPELPWRVFEQRRLQILQQKWRPVRTIALGGVARARLAEWTEAVGAEEPLPIEALVGSDRKAAAGTSLVSARPAGA